MATPMGGGGYYWQPRIDFNWISEGWALFKRDSGTWMVASILAGICVMVVYGVLMFATGYWSAAMSEAQQNNTSANPFTAMYNNGPMFVDQVLIGLAGSRRVTFLADACTAWPFVKSMASASVLTTSSE